MNNMSKKYLLAATLAKVRLQFKENINILFVQFSINEQTSFAKRLSFLIKAGVPLLEALHLIRNQTKSNAKKRIFDSIIIDVSGGQYLSTGLEKFKNYFGEFTINLIRTGELSGILSENLAYLADELAKRHALLRKVRSALVYPIFITLVTLGVTGFLTVFIFPRIMPVFLSLDITLPISTRVLLKVSSFLQSWGVHFIFAIAIFFGIFSFIRSKVYSLRYTTDKILIYIPIVGDIARSYNISNFCRTLGLLLHSGIHITEALFITSSVTKNVWYREAYERIAKKVTEGETISKNIAIGTILFPDLLSHMIAIGEKSGSLTETLRYLSNLYETEVDEKTKNLSNTIEPVLLVVMGLIVSFIAVSVITPIYDITKNLQH